MTGISSFGRPRVEEEPVPPEHVPNLGNATMDLVLVPQIDEAALARMAERLAAAVCAAVASGMNAGILAAVQDAGSPTAGVEPTGSCGCVSGSAAA